MCTYHAYPLTRSRILTNDLRAHICIHKRRYTHSHCTTRRPASASHHAPRPTPQAGSQSKAGARKSRLAVAAVTPRKGAGLLARFDAPAKRLRLLAAADEARRHRLLLLVEEESRAPGPMPDATTPRTRMGQPQFAVASVKRHSNRECFLESVRERGGQGGNKADTISSASGSTCI